MFIKKYIIHRKAWGLIVLYGIVGILFRIFTDINILPPCLWTTILGVQCPSCGMTRAFISLFQFDFQGAWEYNKLIVVVVPFFLFLWGQDMYSFWKKEEQVNNL